MPLQYDNLSAYLGKFKSAWNTASHVKAESGNPESNDRHHGDAAPKLDESDNVRHVALGLIHVGCLDGTIQQ